MATHSSILACKKDLEGLRRRLRPLLPDWISSSPRRLPLSAGSAPGLPRLGQGEADSMVKVQPEETPEHALQGVGKVSAW